MHDEALAYVKAAVSGRRFGRVVEYGSLDINGTVRDVIDADAYFGIDLQDGPGVDAIADASMWRASEPVDLIVCCEVLEHTPAVADIVRSAFANLRVGGLFVVTCATDFREPHSAIDGGPLRGDEWYANVGAQELKQFALDAGFLIVDWTLNFEHGDLYLTAVKP